MSDRNRMDGVESLSWDLVPDECAPSRAIIMQFASREAAHSVLTQAGFSLVSSSVHVLRHQDSRTAVRYTRPDGSTVVLVPPLADLPADAVRRQ